MEISFWRQVKALIWKNYLLKIRHWKTTMVEFILPVIFCLAFLATLGIFAPENSEVHKYFLSQQFYLFVFYLGVVVCTYISLTRFTNFHIPREAEINVDSSLRLMNVSKIASEMSYFLAQQP
jgi:hypothetical protein